MNSKFQSKFDLDFQKLTATLEIKSVKDLAEYLRKFNRNLNDTTIVYCSGEEKESIETTQIALSLLKAESKNAILEVKDKDF